ncbi:MAG: ABC transporter ATP-binding protein [Elusimicrobia bacterium]|nr:ABC transporter ATP-binding protein [Elusimicrobiota bacterium]
MDNILEASDLRRLYHRGSEEIAALDGVSLDIKKGEFVSFVGPSGSGKTTLVNILGCLDNPTSGSLRLAGQEIFASGRVLSETELTRIRRRVFGYVFQRFHLVPTLTVLENVLLPFAFYRKEGSAADGEKLLADLGLAGRKNHLPGQLSGGEMQRVAVARALVNDPEILLADEPTGNLDSKRTEEIKEVLNEMSRKKGVTIVLVTHNPELAKAAQRVVELRDGRIV